MDTRYRTLKFYGVAFPIENSIILTAWIDGQLAFKDEIFSEYNFKSDASRVNNTETVQFLFERQVSFAKHNFELRLKVEGGTLSFGKVIGNYILSKEDNRGEPKNTYSDINGGQEFKSNVRLFGKLIGDYKKGGVFFYPIHNSTFECKISINPDLCTIVPESRAYNRRLGTPDPFPMQF